MGPGVRRTLTNLCGARVRRPQVVLMASGRQGWKDLRQRGRVVSGRSDSSWCQASPAGPAEGGVMLGLTHALDEITWGYAF